MPQMPQNYIYLIRAEDSDLYKAEKKYRYKIGRTDRNPEVRLKELNRQQSQHPLVLQYYTAVSDGAVAEKYFHGKFASYQYHNEWFKMSPRVAASVEQDFINYQPGSIHGAGARSKPRKNKGRSKGQRRKNPWSSILILSGVLLVLAWWSKLPAITNCVSTFDFGKCTKIY
jgi:hypothetical protein